MITVLFISHAASYTGAPMYLMRLVDELVKLDVNVIVFFCDDGPLKSELNSNCTVCYSSKKPKKSNYLSKIIFRILHYFRYVFLIVKYKPDIIYSNTIMNCGEVIIGSIMSFPVIIHMHEGIKFAEKISFKLKIQTFFAHKILVGSKYANSVLKLLTGMNGEVVPIGIPMVSCPIQNTRLLNNPLRLGMLGSIDENKGHLIALKALTLSASKSIELTLHIAGVHQNDDYFSSLKQFVSDAGIESRVFFMGKVSNIHAFFDMIDILVVCSKDEVFPTVILEAFNEHKLVIASNIGGIPELISDNNDGFLFESESEYSLLNSLQKIKLNSDLESIKSKAYSKLIKHYTIHSSAQSVYNVLNAIVNRISRY